MISKLIHAVVDAGRGELFYNIFFALGFVVVIIYTLLNCKNYKISRGKGLLFSFCVYTVTVLWMFFLYWMESGFKNWGGNNIVRIFIWIPVVAYPFCKLMKIDWVSACEFLAPCAAMVQGISHYGCIFRGCCQGYPYAHGIWNPALDINTFPTQPIEACVAVAVVIYVLIRQKRLNYAPDGLTYPIMLMLFGYSRFLLEFLRDNDKIFFGISNLAIHALIMGLVGTAVYVTVKNRKDRKKTKPRHA